MQGAATDFKMFVCARFLVGFGCTLSQLSSPLLLTEIAHPQHRATVTALYNCLWVMIETKPLRFPNSDFNFRWNLGAIVASWLTYGTFRIPNNWAWRIPSILQAFPSIIQFVFLYWVPESPRFMMAHGRGPEALRMLAKCQSSCITLTRETLTASKIMPTAMRPTRQFYMSGCQGPALPAAMLTR